MPPPDRGLKNPATYLGTLPGKHAAFLLEIQNDDNVAVSVGEAILGEMLFIV